MTTITDDQGFIYVDGVKVGRVTSEGKIGFLDKDRRTCAERGSREVFVTPTELVEVVKKARNPVAVDRTKSSD